MIYIQNSGNAIVSGSRDDTARLWTSSSKSIWNSSTIYKGHTRYVSSIAYREPDDSYSQVNIKAQCWFSIFYLTIFSYIMLTNVWHVLYFQGLIYTGCLDGLIRAYEPQNPNTHHTLEGHSGAVASIFVSSNKVNLILRSSNVTLRVRIFGVLLNWTFRNI